MILSRIVQSSFDRWFEISVVLKILSSKKEPVGERIEISRSKDPDESQSPFLAHMFFSLGPHVDCKGVGDKLSLMKLLKLFCQDPALSYQEPDKFALAAS